MYHCIELDIAIDRTIPFHINSGCRYKFIGKGRNGICLMQYDIFKTILPKRQLFVTENIDMIMHGFLLRHCLNVCFQGKLISFFIRLNGHKWHILTLSKMFFIELSEHIK